MAKITVKELQALQVESAGEKVRDDGGLVGVVRARADGVSVKWDWRYRFGGKVRQVAIGSWPRDSLAEIRLERDRLLAILKEGKDPADEKRTLRLQNRADQVEAIADEQRRILDAQAQQARLSVSQLFDRWEKLELSSRKDRGAEVRRSFTKDVLPKIGAVAAEDVRRANIAGILDSVVERGARVVARNLLGDIRQMYGFAIARGLVENDPTSHMKRDDYGQKIERERVLSESEIKQLTTALPSSRMAKANELALWVQLATACRIGELLQARWEHVDLESGTWRIPAGVAKNKKEHTISLSTFAQDKLKALRAINGVKKDDVGEDKPCPWVMPARLTDSHVDLKSLSKQVADRQRGEKEAMSNRSPHSKALVLTGGKWTPHDLRRTAATLMVSIGVLPEVVEKCLNHVEQNKVKRIYQRHSYAAEMKRAWQLLGERLELLTSTNADNVVPIKGKTAA